MAGAYYFVRLFSCFYVEIHSDGQSNILRNWLIVGDISLKLEVGGGNIVLEIDVCNIRAINFN